MTVSHAPGPQRGFGVWGSEKVHLKVLHDPGYQEPVELCYSSDFLPISYWPKLGVVFLSEPVTEPGGPGCAGV